jgi:hypothetical protein
MSNDILQGKTHLVIDDLVADSFANKILSDLCNPFFPWYLSRTLLTVKSHEFENAKQDYDNIQEYLAFIHVFFSNDDGNTVRNSESAPLAEDLFRAILEKLNLNTGEILRVKANFQTQHRSKINGTHNTPHVDNETPHYTGIYYVNDCDGDTFLFDGTKEIAKISPKKGRIVIFDGKTLHAGSHPYNSDFRMVINFNFKV